EDGWFANCRAGRRRISGRVAGRIGTVFWDKARAGDFGSRFLNPTRAWLQVSFGRVIGEVIPGMEQARREMLGWEGEP
ncbi:unnamed protein product, partial [marine sediment metagenome]